MLDPCKRCGQPVTPHDFMLGMREPYHYACFAELRKAESGVRWWQPVLGAAAVLAAVGLLFRCLR